MKKISLKSLKEIATNFCILFFTSCIIFSTLLVLFTVDNKSAKNIALERTNGGEIIYENVEKEFLSNTYKYTILNENSKYEISINSFGVITEFQLNLFNHSSI